MSVLFIQTGGTIDKDYPAGSGAYAFEISTPAVLRMLQRVNPSFEYSVKELFKKDSNDLTDANRRRIRTTCRDATKKRIIITHGTDSMLETARALSGLTHKTIVLTGAVRPERFADSDALFNLGMAVEAVEAREPGVYIAMSGQVIPWDECERDDSGAFVRRGEALAGVAV